MPLSRNPVEANSIRTLPVEAGQLVRLRPPDASEASSESHPVLTFQFNPETVAFSRSGQWEPRKRRRNPDRVQSAQQAFGQHGGHGASALLAESESISFTLMFDATETVLRGTGDGVPDPALGVLPELSFLQLVSLGREVQQGQRARDALDQRIRAVRPDELLLQLGGSRWYPCVMTELSITEQRHNTKLVPIRAECSLTLNVLEPIESAYNNLTRQAFQQLLEGRVRQSGVVGTETSSTLRGLIGGDGG